MDGHTLSPAPIQSALLNSGSEGGSSSPAKKEEDSSMYMVS